MSDRHTGRFECNILIPRKLPGPTRAQQKHLTQNGWKTATALLAWRIPGLAQHLPGDLEIADVQDDEALGHTS